MMMGNDQRADGPRYRDELRVGNWMISDPTYIYEGDDLEEAAYKMIEMDDSIGLFQSVFRWICCWHC